MDILSKKEQATIKKLSSPIKIQNFLDSLPLTWEKDRETYMSPRRSLREKKAHCLEGALIAALALHYHGDKPLILDLKTDKDTDHIVALYQRNGYWGAISKTNHAALRFRDPIYRTTRELVLSYFHEYFDDRTGRKTLRSYSGPLNLQRFKTNWITTEKELDDLAEWIDNQKHYDLFPKSQLKYIRPADKTERRAGTIIEWAKDDPRT